ncbi:unnamed protein product [Rotaria socialis]|uniref:Transposase n=2 Tax=Rotaria socialis TaxID=392032 RepID=A0A821C121_9BILA|nr:unnamed protein product [Rotaria socialis]CAF4602680.1 unnamed protein product [Rotaria socialis]CAF4791704.1 unnamed protein product [Rotaria socialis]CAF4853362.1 unnamed protein product [Rotaria socialis]
MTHDGMSSLQIAKQLRKVVSERTVRRWQHLYRSTDTIDLKTPAGGIFNRQNDRVYASSRHDADEHKGTNRRPSFQKKLLVWLATSKNGLSLPIIFEPGETLTHENYIEIVLPHARAEGQRLLGDDFIYQQDNATPHKHKDSIAWIKKNFPRFIDVKNWPPNSPDLNVLDYYMWDAIGHNMHWDKVKRYDSLIDEIKKGISSVSKNDLLRSVQNWSSYSSNYVVCYAIF